MDVKKGLSWVLLVGVFLAHSSYGQQVTLYDYFTDGDPNSISSGLTADQPEFFNLNGKDLKLFGGSLHYFRVHPSQWRDRLRKFRAAGLNAVDVYVPWNLHEPERGVFDFGDGGRDFSPFLDLPAFLTMAKEEDLFVVFRPGPYICGEWEFGGLPSWLLSEHPMFVRTTHDAYQQYAERYLREVISRVKDLQFYTASGNKGGPIIMTQVENEYGNFGYGDWPRDKAHLQFLMDVMADAGIETIFFTSDSPNIGQDYGNVEGLLMTANFKWNSIENMNRLLELQPNRPIFVTEYWPGWFDHWFEPRHTILTLEDFTEILSNIFDYKGSVNFYMFHGGTNFGFMNGGNLLESGGIAVFPFYAPDVTSYDYDAPLSENGGYTPKYDRAAEMIAAYDPLASLLIKPPRPAIVPPVNYGQMSMTEIMDYDTLLSNVNPSTHVEQSYDLKAMEQLALNNGNGQSYGYVVYRKTVQNLQDGSTILIRGHVRDLLMLMINGKMVNEPIYRSIDLNKFGSFGPRDSNFTIDLTDVPIPDGQVAACVPECTLDFMVENLGRANFGQPHQFDQKKGLWQGNVLIDGQPIKDWTIMSLEFDGAWVSGLQGWQPLVPTGQPLDIGPKVFRGTFNVPDAAPKDTYFDFGCNDPSCQDWYHGSFYVNGFNIGRYFHAGPQKTLYIPGPFLVQGQNEIIVMENYRGTDRIQFTDVADYGPHANSSMSSNIHEF